MSTKKEPALAGAAKFEMMTSSPPKVAFGSLRHHISKNTGSYIRGWHFELARSDSKKKKKIKSSSHFHLRIFIFCLKT
jgi:hypothetical protein